MLYWILKTLFGPIFRMIWIKKVEGLENLPKNEAYIVAANHSSYFDFFCISAVSPRRVYFLAGEVFFKKWWWRPLVELTGQVKVDRNAKDKTEAKQKVLSLLSNGKILGIFPEGTRSADGMMGKTFTGVAKFALGAKVSVVPVGITGAYEVFSRHEKLPRFKKNIILRIGKPIYFKEYYEKSNSDAILRQITDEIIQEIEELKI